MPQRSPDDGAAGLRPGVSVFRPGQPLPRGTVTVADAPPRAPMLPQLVFAAPSPARVWEQLVPLSPDAALLSRNNLFPQRGEATAAFDLLRTRLLPAMAGKGWQTLGIAGPRAGAGASFTAMNLALALARLEQTRTVLVDLDLGAPQHQARLGAAEVPPLADVLAGSQPFEAQFRRLGANLALGLNGAAVADPAAVLLAAATAEALAAVTAGLAPDIVLCDLPPALDGDGFAAALPLIDALLMVIDGSRTTAAEVRAVEALVAGRVPVMGTVLNRAQG